MIVKQSAPWSYSRTVVVLIQIIRHVSLIVAISDADTASCVAPVINSVEYLLKKTFEVKIGREVGNQTSWPRQTGPKHYPTNEGQGENLQHNYRDEKK